MFGQGQSRATVFNARNFVSEDPSISALASDEQALTLRAISTHDHVPIASQPWRAAGIGIGSNPVTRVDAECGGGVSAPVASPRFVRGEPWRCDKDSWLCYRGDPRFPERPRKG